MQMKRLVPYVAIFAVALLGSAPAVWANPISPSLSWTAQQIPLGSSTMATVSVLIDTDCPSGQTYSGTITVTEPDGVSVATYSVPATPCGSSVTATYPGSFTGTAGTSENGAYTGVWAGSTSTLTGGQHPIFSVSDNFVVGQFPPPVPQFSTPVIAVSALGLVLVALAKRGRALKV